MIKEIMFPEKESYVKNNEYNHHYMFIKKFAEFSEIKVKTIPQTNQVWCGKRGIPIFSILIDNK